MAIDFNCLNDNYFKISRIPMFTLHVVYVD